MRIELYNTFFLISIQKTLKIVKLTREYTHSPDEKQVHRVLAALHGPSSTVHNHTAIREKG